ncbi:L,D-transpeptidase [Kushneria phosphatilytica]|uniref:L,D-transpeptidase n=1 Tax=Kushneria phosphatilytica TaxID=657387 RepID=A0A1S1NUZ7_9GAMM|nr:L,D-transpeptidase [Kushneria phosphatilytica]OHV10037.1 hypothetical protein BH688_10560 [Kushneria phosphatilytica]QEL11725.1 L,D-transpeptidase [Kushneria phosphatilytica]
MRRLTTPLLLLTLCLSLPALAVPFWGARDSSPVDTSPTALKAGDWIWLGHEGIGGPMAVIVSLTEQRAYVYRNGILIGVTTISSGRQGYETPTGVFTVLQKDRDHRSNLYGNAPMPYQQRLTWDGVALHAGGLPGYPESHGCVHLPSEFARLLFDASTLGMTVVVTETGKAPMALVHPGPLSPIDPHTGTSVDTPLLADGHRWRWEPWRSDEGPLSMVLSRSDQLLIVYRNGVEIGRSRVTLQHPEPRTGTHAYIVAGDHTTSNSQETMPDWIAIGVPGREAEAGSRVPINVVNQVVIPEGFQNHVLPLLSPGTVLVATDAHLQPENTGQPVRVIDAEAPQSWLDAVPMSRP